MFTKCHKKAPSSRTVKINIEVFCSVAADDERAAKEREQGVRLILVQFRKLALNSPEDHGPSGAPYLYSIY